MGDVPCVLPVTLSRGWTWTERSAWGDNRCMSVTEVQVGRPGSRLGDLTMPDDAVGTVIFAHGSGSSRHSPRNRWVAEQLNRRHVGTLLFDLLTPGEETDRRNVFDIGLLADRLVSATRWFQSSADGPIGYFGASTGAAAALRAAVQIGSDIAAIVSRGGRPDLATGYLDRVAVPTLLIVGGEDPAVLEMNRSAQRDLQCEHHLEVVPGAGHLFEEPGTLDRVAELAGDWFESHFSPPLDPDGE